MQTPRQRYCARLGSLKQARAPWDAFYREVGDYLLPWRVRFSDNDKFKREASSAILDPTGTLALRASAAGMSAGICSPARRWKRLTLPTPTMGNSSAAKRYLQEVDEVYDWVLLRSGFYGVVSGSVFPDLLAFATAAMLGEEDTRTILRWKPLTTGSYWLAANGDGEVETLYRVWKFSVAQMVGEYGLESVSATVRDQYRRGQFDVEHHLLQVVEPNRRDTETGMEGMRAGMWGWEGMEFRSVHMELSRQDDSGTSFLRTAGYHDFPATTPVWGRTVPEDTYGTGPGMVALPEIKQLQTMTRRKLQMVEKQSLPALAGPEMMGVPSQLPGTYTAIPSGSGAQRIEPTYVPDHGAVNQVREDIRELQGRVRESLYADLWRLITDDDRAQRATAEEIRAAREEKLSLLGPVLQNVEEQFLRRVLDRVWSAADRAGVLPVPPPELDGVELRVEFLSVFGDALKAQQIPGIERAASFITALAQVDPNVLDVLEGEKVAEKYFEVAGLPPDLLRSPEARAALRQARAAKEQAAQMAAQLQATAGAARDLGGASLENDTALSRIVNGYGPAVAAAAGTSVQAPGGIAQ